MAVRPQQRSILSQRPDRFQEGVVPLGTTSGAAGDRLLRGRIRDLCGKEIKAWTPLISDSPPRALGQPPP